MKYLILLISINTVVVFSSFISVLVCPLRTHERLYARMRRTTVQRKAPQSVHVHADTSRIRKGKSRYKENSKYNVQL